VAQFEIHRGSQVPAPCGKLSAWQNEPLESMTEPWVLRRPVSVPPVALVSYLGTKMSERLSINSEPILTATTAKRTPAKPLPGS
jgi:hypothetical protein